MLYKNHTEFEKLRNEIMERLNKEGIRVKKGKKEPMNREYSGLIGCEGKVLKLEFKNN